MTEKIVFTGGGTTITTAEGSVFEDVENQLTGKAAENPSQSEPQGQEQAKNPEPSKDTQGTENRPEWLPANFKTVEDYVKSNQEAQRKITEQAQKIKELETGKTSKPESEVSPETQKAAEEQLTPEEQKDLVQKLESGHFEDYSKEYYETGTLSDESRQAIIKAGVPESLLNTHIAGYEALMSQRDSQIYGVLGGQEKADVIFQWASTNLDATTVEQFNTAFANQNVEAAKDQARALLARYTEANGDEPDLIQGGEGVAGDKPYETHQEMMADMKNPLYKAKGPQGDAFRDMVDRKLMMSDKVMNQVRDVTRTGNY
jgi:hypothetical protein